MDPARSAALAARRKDGETAFSLARERGRSPLSLSQLINVGCDRGRHSELKGAVAGLRQDGSPAVYDKKG